MGQRVGWGFANDENCSCHVQLWEQLSCTVCHQFPSCSLVLIRLSCKQQIRLIFFLNTASAQSELWILREKTKRQTRCLCSLRHESFANTVKAIKIAMFKQERWHTTITVVFYLRVVRQRYLWQISMRSGLGYLRLLVQVLPPLSSPNISSYW